MELDQTQGLVCRSDGEVHFTGRRRPVVELDRFTFPAYQGFELGKYYTSEVSLITSRGCPYGCSYCKVRLIMGSRIRLRSAGSVADEVESWVKRGYRSFFIEDDKFSHDRNRTLEICDEIQRRNLGKIRISLANGLRADKTDNHILNRLREVGAWEIQFGVESVNNHVLKLLRKAETIEQITSSVEKAILLE